MRKPTIDELLNQVDSIFELTMLAAKEATRIRLKDREIKQPLQLALDRIAEGKVRGSFLDPDGLEEYNRNEQERREAAAIRDRMVIPPPPPKT